MAAIPSSAVSDHDPPSGARAAVRAPSAATESNACTPAPPAGAEIAALRRQESLLILLNLGVLAALILIHLVFAPFVPTTVWVAVGLFAGRMAMQALELVWLYHGHPSLSVLRRYEQLSVWVNVAFASLASLVSGVPHSHYIVLMVVPTIAAAFRASRFGLAAVVGVAISVTFLYVGVYQKLSTGEERVDETFEAATDTLAYLAIAIVVRALVVQWRKEQQRLRDSLWELERTRDRLVAEEKLAAVGRLSAAIAHEIRNPVGMIASAVATARQAGYAPAARDEMFAIVAQESGRLERLTRDFLSFARQAAPQLAPTSIRTALEYVAALVRPRAAECRQTLVVDCPMDEEARLDADQVHQALLNLAANALDAAGPGATVTLGAQHETAGALRLFVKNPGPAIPADVASRLFEPFFTTKAGGTGLGLAISRKIARAHCGELRLTHNAPDQVEFSLVLPVAHPAQRDEVPHAADPDR